MGESTGQQDEVHELFTLLGNQTRMEILLTLWRELDPEAHVEGDPDALSFSELFEQCESSDTGNFNYHLGRLQGSLLEQNGEEYALTPTGFSVLQGLATELSTGDRSIDSQVIDDPCPFCEGRLEASYSREILRVDCLDCAGLTDGYVLLTRCPPSAFRDGEVRTLLDVGTLRLQIQLFVALAGFCISCFGRTSAELEICDEHDPVEGRCASCERRFGAIVRVRCTNCSGGGAGPALEYGMVAPNALSFFDRHDLGPATAGPWAYRLAFLERVEEVSCESDRPRARYTVESDGDRCEFRIAASDEDVVVGRR